VAVVGGKKFTQLKAGDGHTCGRESSGSAWCWGANGSGQLGNGTTSAGSAFPVSVNGGPFQQIVAGSGLTCALLIGTGAAYCWGTNVVGQLGGGTRTDHVTTTPQPVVGGIAFTGLAVAGRHACGFTDLGSAYCWGSNASGQLGTGIGIGVVTAPRLVGQ
jgi:alpha-tubulin suppressor-like RCC1 family protein